MAANFLDVATLFGGGLLGVLAGLYAAGQKFSSHLSELADTVEKVLKDPRHSDLNALVAKARVVEKDAKTLLGMVKQVVKG